MRNKYLLILSLMVSVFTNVQAAVDPIIQSYSDLLLTDPAQAEQIMIQALKNVPVDSKKYLEYQNKLAQANYYLDRYDEGKERLKATIERAKEESYTEILAEAYFLMGDLMFYSGEHSSAIDNLSLALKIYQETEDNQGIGACYNSLGLINMNQENFKEAETNFLQSLKYGDQILASDSYIYLGKLYLRMGAFEDADRYADKALKIAVVTNDSYVLSEIYDVKSGCLINKKNFEEAKAFLLKSLVLKEELEDFQGQAVTLVRLGEIYTEVNNLDSAYYCYLRAFKSAKEIGAKEEIKKSSNALLRYHAERLEYDSAYFYQSFYIQMVEDLSSERASKKMAELKGAADKQKKEAELQQEKLENEQSKLVAKQERRNSYYSYGGLLLSLIFGIFIFNRFKISQKQKKIIEIQKDEAESLKLEADRQKELVEEKNHEILDSINYAKRIQKAILPPDKLFKEQVKNGFVLYLPKDIVAGDFYWMEPMENGVLLAAADCTGHGVPGAMVSVICNNGLNRSVREFGLREPAKILDKTREIIIQEFEKSEEEVKDGMDISLVSLAQNQSNDSHSPLTFSLCYAGAHNPLWIIRKGSEEIEEIKADKQPVGKFSAASAFTNNQVVLSAGDSVYLFSDGYADQFGGEKGKKMKTVNFKEYLLTIQEHSMDVQKELLHKQFEQWRGEFEQLDDVCVIGFKV